VHLHSGSGVFGSINYFLFSSRPIDQDQGTFSNNRESAPIINGSEGPYKRGALMKFLPKLALGLLASSLASSFLIVPPALADESSSDNFLTRLEDALTAGQVSASLRYRYANIEQAGFAQDAAASTYQIMFGYESGELAGFSFMGQVRHVGALSSERYNSTTNGLVQYPVEADPEATEVDQLFLRYNGIPNLSVTLGRRKLSWGNQRFVSALGWRQNNRSFDGIVVESTPVNGLAFRYAYSQNVNRAFTDESPVGNFDGDFHLFNGIYSGLEGSTLTGYAYVNDFDDAFALGLSSQTFGANFTTSHAFDNATVGLTLEFANQSDYGNHPSSYDANYYRVEPSLSAYGFTVKAGYEVLEGDGSNSFKTPFALLHAYNGWADQFLATPGQGLEDTYGSVSYRFGAHGTPELFDGITATVAYHEFQAENISMDYGTEWDASLIIPINEHFSTGFKYADYQSDGFKVDTTKAWWFVTIRY